MFAKLYIFRYNLGISIAKYADNHAHVNAFNVCYFFHIRSLYLYSFYRIFLFTKGAIL